MFICGNMSISCDDPNIKDVIISFVLKTSETLYPLDFLGTQFFVGEGCYFSSFMFKYLLYVAVADAADKSEMARSL